MGVAAAALHAGWQLARLDIDDPQRCLILFRANRDFGLLIFAGAVIDSLLKS
jgi:4-hydroxybenzoate polyprenyltransferase